MQLSLEAIRGRVRSGRSRSEKGMKIADQFGEAREEVGSALKVNARSSRTLRQV